MEAKSVPSRFAVFCHFWFHFLRFEGHCSIFSCASHLQKWEDDHILRLASKLFRVIKAVISVGNERKLLLSDILLLLLAVGHQFNKSHCTLISKNTKLKIGGGSEVSSLLKYRIVTRRWDGLILLYFCELKIFKVPISISSVILSYVVEDQPKNLQNSWHLTFGS